MQHAPLAGQRQHLEAAGRAQRLVVGELAEAVDVDEAVHRLPAVAQFLQGADAQAAEGEHAARLQYAVRLAEHGGEVGAPLQGQAGEDQVLTRRSQRQALGIAADELAGAAQRPGVAQHALGDVDGGALPCGEAFGQRAAEVPGAAAQIDPARRLQIGGQARQQLGADRALQLGDAVVAGRGAREGGGDLALVRQTRYLRVSHGQPRETAGTSP
ncbi:hypothetical protein D3C75_961450 [compost metagenome]